MGRKAKLKKARKSEGQKIDSSNHNSDQFVEHLERQGYSLKKPKVAPEMPKKNIEPQV